MQRNASPYAALPVIVAAQVGTSTTSLSIGTGTKAFSTQTGRIFRAGGWVIATSDANPNSNWMHGVVLSYVGGVLTVDVQRVSGGGTHTDWTISPSGPPGEQGDTGTDGQSQAIKVDLVVESSSLTLAELIPGLEIDGVVLAENMDFLRPFASTGSARGLFTVQPSGAAVRKTGFDVSYDSLCGLLISVARGDKYRKTVWKGVSLPGGTLGSTSVNFARQLDDVQQVLQPRYDIVCDGSSLLIPAFWYIDPVEGFVDIAPTDGARYFEKTLSTSTTDIYRYWYDREADQGSATATESIMEELDEVRPSGRMYQRPEIATSCNSKADSPFSIVGEKNGGLHANQFPEGKDPAKAGMVYSDGAVVDVTGANLLAAGFTKGIRGTVGSFYGTGLKEELYDGNYYGFWRVRVETDTPDDFGSGHAVYFYTGTDSSLGSIDLVLEKKISSTEAIYSHFRRIGTSVNGARKIAVGCFKGTSAGITVTGVQFAHDTVPVRWIRRDDFSAALDLDFVMGKDLFMIAGRKQSIYPRNLLRDRHAVTQVFASFTSVKASAQNKPYVAYGMHELVIDPDEIGTTAELRIQAWYGDIARNYKIGLTCHVAAASGLTGSPVGLAIGDSLTNRGLLNKIKPKVDSTGLTVSWVGTIATSNTDGSTSATDGYLGEAREGRALADIMYEKVDGDTPAPFDDAALAAYEAGSKSYKEARNPMLRPSTGGDDPGVVFNGYVFDLAFYLARPWAGGAIVTPDIVVIGLGKNDGLEESLATSVADVLACLPVMLARIRDDLPSAKILVWYPTEPWSHDARARWPENIAITAALIKCVNDFADANCRFVPVHAHQAPLGDWRLDTSPAADASTGIQVATIVDTIHFGYGAIREQAAEPLAAAIANVV